MYIEKLIIHNLGAIDKFELTENDLLKEDGNPKPIVLLGKNGSGKTTVLSSIADSFFEIANAVGFEDILPKSGNRYSYFKLGGGLTQKINTDYSLCFIKYNNNLQHLEYTKNLTVEQCCKYIKEEKPPGNLIGSNQGNKISNILEIDKENLIKDIIAQNAYLYFPSDRFEYPHWMNQEFITNNFSEINISRDHLGKKILVRNNLHNIKQWLKDIVLNSRAEVTWRSYENNRSISINTARVNMHRT